MRREWPTDIGPVDLMCRDENDEFVAVEIKRVGTIDAVEQLGSPTHIPRLDTVSSRLERISGWRLVGVPGLIPEEAFFALLAQRRFPVTDWMRRPEEFDYVVVGGGSAIDAGKVISLSAASG
mgnify:CR=1 FL=1